MEAETKPKREKRTVDFDKTRERSGQAMAAFLEGNQLIRKQVEDICLLVEHWKKPLVSYGVPPNIDSSSNPITDLVELGLYLLEEKSAELGHPLTDQRELLDDRIQSLLELSYDITQSEFVTFAVDGVREFFQPFVQLPEQQA